MKITIMILALIYAALAWAQPKDSPLPALLVKIEPPYPETLMKQCVEGTVTVQYTVNAKGSVQDIEVVSHEGPEAFIPGTKRAIQNWKFKPKVVGGKPVSQRLEQPISYQLPEEYLANCASPEQR